MTLATGERRVPGDLLHGASVAVAVAQPQLALAPTGPSAQDLVFATQPETLNALLLTRSVPLEMSQTAAQGTGPQITLGEAQVTFNEATSTRLRRRPSAKGPASPKGDELDSSGWFKQSEE